MPAPKKPQDHQSKADADEPTTYTHTLPDGRSFTLPLLSQLKTNLGFKRRIRRMSETDQMIEVIELAADEKALAVLDTFDDEELAAFSKDWAEASGIDVGELSASSGS